MGIMIDSDLLWKYPNEFIHHIFDLYYMDSCLRDQKQVQDKQFDGHLTGVRK